MGTPQRSWFATLRQYENVLWAAVLVGMLAWRWPVLKGYYYKYAGVSAPADRIEWRTDYRAALAESARSGRPVLVDFSASWCPPCIAMKHDTWTAADVASRVNASFIPLMVDVDHDPATSSHFGIEAIPTILLVDARGEVIRRAGFLPASGMLRFLDGD
ncbi:MAG: thioredoxin family protein [Vicinamibacterales bacterium]